MCRWRTCASRTRCAYIRRAGLSSPGRAVSSPTIILIRHRTLSPTSNTTGTIFVLYLLTFILSRCFAAARLALAAHRAYDGAPWSTTDKSKWVVVCAVVTAKSDLFVDCVVTDRTGSVFTLSPAASPGCCRCARGRIDPRHTM